MRRDTRQRLAAALPPPPAARMLNRLEQFAAAGLIAQADLASLAPVAAAHALGLTPQLAGLIDPADPDDPIARQFVPDARELAAGPDESDDPIGDGAHAPVEGIVHRYPDRVLLKLIHTCPVYCRYCFRKAMVGPEGDGVLAGAALEAAYAYIAGRREVREVILTGGDPLMLSARRIRETTARLSALPQIEVIRWHSRVPVADPARIDGAVIEAMSATGRSVVLVIHANHARELDGTVQDTLAALRRAGILLLAQSVLLKGVNDDAPQLEALFRRLIACGVKPYYLHHPDRAPGTGHFRVGIAEGLALMAALRGRLSGIALPDYVIDIPGGHGKVPVASLEARDGRFIARDRHGRAHMLPAGT